MPFLPVQAILPTRLDDRMATLYEPQAIAPEKCPECRAKRTFWSEYPHPESALYACGTTTLMLAEGWHNDARNDDERNRTLAHWRQHLVATNRTHLDDPMLAGYRARPPPPEPARKTRGRRKA